MSDTRFFKFAAILGTASKLNRQLRAVNRRLSFEAAPNVCYVF